MWFKTNYKKSINSNSNIRIIRVLIRVIRVK